MTFASSNLGYLMAINRIASGMKRAESPSVSTSVDAIVQAFNTWAYKREQPSDISLLRSFVSRAVQCRQPVPFVLYWGKGPRSQIAEPDETCLDFLVSMEARIKSVYADGARIHLLLTDTHARLNEHSAEDISSYFTEITTVARARGFEVHRLSDVVAEASPRVDSAVKEIASAELTESLRRSAEKWYFGADSASQAAATYFATNMRERAAVETIHPHSIFITFNNKAMRPLFPEKLPIFYMYSLRKGVAVKPWFMSDERDSRRPFAPPHRAAAIQVVAAAE